jgi:hypothetical protein
LKTKVIASRRALMSEAVAASNSDLGLRLR